MVGPALALLILTADYDKDGIVNSKDLSHMLSNWGGSDDLNNDGEINGHDLAILFSIWRSGWGFNHTGDGQLWVVEPGAAMRVEPSPFAGYRRLTFLSEAGVVMSIDTLLNE